MDKPYLGDLQSHRHELYHTTEEMQSGDKGDKQHEEIMAMLKRIIKALEKINAA